MRRIRAVLALMLAVTTLALPGLAGAQDLPRYASTYINDLADLLTDEQEVELTNDIAKLRGDTGAELVVLTLASRVPYGWDSLEPFATALFNDWGIGDADRNDGILVLVLSDDREMRIELGSGYGPGFNRVSQSIVDTDFLPAFRDGAFDRGIMNGTRAVITEVARQYAAADQAQHPGFWKEYGSFAIFAAAFLAIIGIGRRRWIGDQMTRFRRCPTCHTRALHVTRETTVPPTRDNQGHGLKHVTCSNCGYDVTERFRIASPGKSSSGSFGGGSSSGGGASGRW